jgi:hypothetical protein
VYGVRAYLDEALDYFREAAKDPCTAFGHGCRCPLPGADAWLERARAEHEAQVQRFRALFVTTE